MIALLKARVKWGLTLCCYICRALAVLVNWCIDVAKCSVGRNMDDLLNFVEKIVKEDGRITPFKNDRPGKKWYNSFLNRNSELSHLSAEPITKGRGIAT